MFDFKTLSKELNLDEEDYKKRFKFYKRLIDYYTFERPKDDDRVLECINELINLDLKDEEKLKNYKTDGIKSETVGSQRVEYQVYSLDEVRKLYNIKTKRIYSIIKSYFAHTGLMYRGG